MEYWSIVEDPISDVEKRGLQNCSAGSGTTMSSKIPIHSEVFCSLFFQYPTTPELQYFRKKIAL